MHKRFYESALTDRMYFFFLDPLVLFSRSRLNSHTGQSQSSFSVFRCDNKPDLLLLYLAINTAKANKTFAVAAVTFANGGDNIGIYIPLFAPLLMPQKIIMIIIFLTMVTAW